MSIGVGIWSVQAVASGASLAAGHPWTARLSRRRYSEQVRAHPLFVEANQLITGAWTVYFAIAAVATGLIGPWIAIAFTVPTPILGWLSYLVGDRYAPWKLRRSHPQGDTSMTTPKQAELRALIVDKNDDEILDWMSGTPGGVGQVLDETVAGMADVLDREAAQDCVVGYEIDSTDATYSYRIEIQGHEVQAERREPADARVVLQLTVPEYLRLITGLLDGTEAFMTGRMKIRGDVMFAPQIAQMFPRPS
jgi:putative sterol carrier protein